MERIEKSLPNLEDLAARIKWARKLKGWSQSNLADRIGVDQTTISQMEDGKINHPRNIVRLGKELGVSPAWLQFGTPEIDKLSKRSISFALEFENIPETDKKTIESLIARFK